jgi:hypothetical protein
VANEALIFDEVIERVAIKNNRILRIGNIKPLVIILVKSNITSMHKQIGIIKCTPPE